MRLPILICLAVSPCFAALPTWWTAFTRMPSLESRFRQESDSLVFGKLARQGRLALARGGRLRVTYEGGLSITCDGRHLVQYDPDTRTAQRVELARAAFLCMTPLRQALSTRPWVEGSSLAASSFLPPAMRARKLLTAVFRVERLLRLRRRASASRRAFLAADL